MTGITRRDAAAALAELFGTRASYSGGRYSAWVVKDQEGKTWSIVYDSSIRAKKKSGCEYISTSDDEFKVEMVSPKLEYSEMEKLQDVVRALRHAGAIVGEQCGQHVHIDAANHTPQSLKNALSIMYSKEDILFKALQVDESRVGRWCKKVRETMLKNVRKLPSNASMSEVKKLWYDGRGGSANHYDETRYHALNLHAVFSHGTLEWRCFNSTLHAGEVRANITLALAISALAINQKCAHMSKTPITENPCFTFRTFLLRLGMIGPEYKNVREHLLCHLEGDRAWRYSKDSYECLKTKKRQEPER